MESNHHCYKYKTINDWYHNLMFYINNTFVPLDIIIVQNLPDQYGCATFTPFTEAEGRGVDPHAFHRTTSFQD